MCGIVGFNNPDNNADKTIISMIDAIDYRGPDEKNILINEKLAIGHNRLSIIGLNFGKQPCIDPKSRNVLVFNGEIYNFLEIQKKLQNKNIFFKSSSDTDTLFYCLLNFGVDETIRLLDGMFSFVYFDDKKNKIYLVKDKFGEKPLYYYYDNKNFVFSSEIKSILKNNKVNQKLSTFSLNKYLFFDYVPNPLTLFENIFKVEPGEIITYSLNNFLEKKKYIKYEKNINLNKGFSNENNFKSVLENSIKSRLISDVPLGIFLSGGLDSSLITAIAKKYDNNITTHTIKFEETSYDESIYAKEVAQYFKIKHFEYNINKNELTNNWDNIIKNLDDPINDSSLIPTYLLSKYSKNSIKVALTGDGSDELFGGYINFKVLFFSSFLKKINSKGFIKEILKLIIKKLPNNDKYMSNKFLFNQLTNGLGKNEFLQTIYCMSSFNEDNIFELTNNEFDVNKYLFKILSEFKNSNINKHNFLTYYFLKYYLSDNILVKSDRSSMMNSIELRSPFLSHELSDYILQMQRNEKYNLFKSKINLRKIASSYLPNHIVNRKKHGFALNTSNLIKKEFNKKIKETLFDKSNILFDRFDNQYINKLIFDHENNLLDNRKKIWSLFTIFSYMKSLHE